MTRMDQKRAAEPELLTVGQVAEAYAVTVRTLHHYDRIGLLRPSARSMAGYRLYDPTDLTRLRDIVVYRRLGLPLEEIAAVLDDPGAAASHLTRQRALVMSRLDELRDLVEAIDHALEKEMTGQPLTTEELRELFGGEFSDGYAEDAERQLGRHAPVGPGHGADRPLWPRGVAGHQGRERCAAAGVRRGRRSGGCRLAGGDGRRGEPPAAHRDVVL